MQVDINVRVWIVFCQLCRAGVWDNNVCLGDGLCYNGVVVVRNTYSGGMIVAVKKIGELYRCNICGNQVKVTKVGGGELVCCGEEMELIEEE